MNLSNPLFSKKTLYGEIVSNHDFAKQTLSHLTVEECLFESVDFSGANFAHSRFIDCTFRNCNLSLAVVKEARFDHVEFIECKMVGINWYELAENRIMGTQLLFDKCILTSCSFSGLHMPKSQLIECKLHDVDFAEADCEAADFSYADCSEALFHNTNLRECNFCYATNYYINLYTNNVDKASFSPDEALNLLTSSGLIIASD